MGNKFCSGLTYNGVLDPMLKGYRVFIIAAFGWLTLAAASQGENNSDFKKGRTEQQIANTTGRIADALETANEPKREMAACPKGGEDRKSELCAQWRAADAASMAVDAAYVSNFIGWIGVVLGTITMFAAIAAAYFAKRAADETKRSADIAKRDEGNAVAALIETRRAADASVDQVEIARSVAKQEMRPWLVVTADLSSEITVTADHIMFFIYIIVNNVGKGVANKIVVQPHGLFYLDRHKSDAWFGERRNIHQVVESGYLSPGEKLEMNYAVLIEKEKLGLNSDNFIPHVLISVFYQSLDEDRAFQTGKAYDVFEISSGVTKVFPYVVGSIARENCSFVRSVVGCDYVQ